MLKPELVDVALAVQAASLAGNYLLALRLLHEHDMLDCCVGCVTGKILDMRFRFNNDHAAYTCENCTEVFARWLTDSVNRFAANRLFD